MTNQGDRTVHFRLLGPDGVRWLRDQTVPHAETSPDGLRKRVRIETGQEALLLHDGGLSVGQDNATVTMEIMSRQPAGGHEVPNARPWQRPGWHRTAFDWLDTQLAQHGEARVGIPVQISTHDLAAVLLAQTTTGRVYLKASTSGHEARSMALLATRWPDLVPVVLGADPAAGLLLTREAGPSLHACADTQRWLQAVSQLARFQQTPWPGLDAPEHAFDQLPDQFEQLSNDQATLMAWGLKPAHIGALRAALPALRAAWERVEALGLPLTPVHGDAHPMNVRADTAGPRWFDWSDLSRAHPFTDIGWFLTWLGLKARAALPVRQIEPDLVRQLWAAFCASWSLDARMSLRDAQIIALTHRAVVYDQNFRHWTGTVARWRPQYVPYTLRLLLSVVEDATSIP